MCSVDGRKTGVTKADVNERTPRIVLVRDVSGSMAHSKANSDIALAAATGLIRSLPPSAKIALLSFAGNIVQRTDFSHPVAEVLKEVQNLPIRERGHSEYWGKRPFNDGSTINILESPLSGDTIYVISDAGENRSHATARDVAHCSSRQRGIPNRTNKDGHHEAAGCPETDE